jgi:hypothetical protein
MWRSAAVWAFLLGCAGAAGGGELAGERWAGKDTPCAHPGTLRWIQSGKTPRLVLDLSALPKEARIHRASLRCVKQGDGQPADPVRIHVTESLDAEGNAVFGGKPLALEGPWYRSLDATEAVRLWSREPGRNLGFAVASFEGLVAPQTCLDILYEGAAKDVPPQVEELRALHHDGQTFLMWKEHAAFRPAPEEVIWVERWDERGDKLAGGSGEGADGLPRSPAITLRTLRRLQGLGLRD